MRFVDADRPPRPQPRNIARLASQEHQRVKEAASIGRGSPASADSQRDRNNSFFTGLEPQHRTNQQARSDSPSSSRSATPQQYDPADDGSGSSIRAPTEVQDRGERRSSFYGLEGHVVRPSASGRDLQQQRRQQPATGTRNVLHSQAGSLRSLIASRQHCTDWHFLK